MVSFVTATIALVNSMIGSAILILPVLFVQNGLIISIAIIFIAALASGYLNTCSLEHTIENENDYSQTLERHHKDSNITFWYGFFLFLSS
jgi:amino acid permease